MLHVQNGQSPLLVASEHGHHEIVKILLKHHARVDVFDEVSPPGRRLASSPFFEIATNVDIYMYILFLRVQTSVYSNVWGFALFLLLFKFSCDFDVIY